MSKYSYEHIDLSDENMKKVENAYRISVESLLKDEKDILKEIQKSKCANTQKLLYNKAKILIELKNTLQLAIENNNYYGANIIMRSLCEHNMIAFYVWISSNKNTNDKCAEEYYNEYVISEKIKQENYKLKIEGIQTNDKEVQNLEELKKRFDFLHDKDQKYISDVHNKAGQFKIDRIANYLFNKIIEDHPFKPFIEGTIGLNLQEYNLLSSFVHGGPYAEEEKLNEMDSEKANKLKKKLKYLSHHFTRMVITMLYSLVNIETDRYSETLTRMFAKNE